MSNDTQVQAHMALVDEYAEARIVCHPAAEKARAAVEAALRDAPQAEPNMTLDGLTPQQFALRELYEFQEATGCDTAEQFLAMPWDVLRDRMLAATPSAPTAVEPWQQL